jgi:hypothetical protein
MKSVKVSAAAQRAFKRMARNTDLREDISFKIHKGTGECVCTACEEARRWLHVITHASKP